MAIAPRAQRGGTSAPGQSAPTVPANFGQGQNITDDILRLTGVVANYTAQVRGRQDTIEAARIRQQFSEFSQAELVRLSSEQDFSREETFNAYKASLINRKRDLITNAPLTGDGRAKVDAELTNILGVGVAEAAQMRVAEQNRVVATALNQQMGEIMASISTDPSAPLTDRLLQVDDLIRGYAPALTPEKEAALRTAATGQVVEAYMQPLVEAADTEGLRNMLNDPTVRNALGQEQYRVLSTQLRVQEVKKATEAAERAARADRLAAAGVDVSNPRIALALEGLNPNEIYPQPSTDPKIRQMEFLIANGTAPEEALNRVFPVRGAGTTTSGTAAERAVGTMRDTALSYLSTGSISLADADSLFATAATTLRGRRDASGVVVPGVLPPVVEMAFQQMGITPEEVRRDPTAAMASWMQRSGGMMPSPQQLSDMQESPPIPQIGAQAPSAPPAPAQTPEQQEATVSAATQFAPLYSVDPETFRNDVAAPALDFLETDTAEAPPAPSFSLFGTADLLVGPENTVSSFIARVPGMDPSQAQQALLTARQNAKITWETIVQGFQNSPRFAQGERDQLRAVLTDIQPDKIWGNPGAYRAAVTGASNFLLRSLRAKQRQLEGAERSINEGTSGASNEQIRMLRLQIPAIEFAIESLGAHDLEGNPQRPTDLGIPQSGLTPEEEAELRQLEALEAQQRAVP